jgi:hypothetical protein
MSPASYRTAPPRVAVLHCMALPGKQANPGAVCRGTGWNLVAATAQTPVPLLAGSVIQMT